jgi:hypothetical protein
MTGMNRNRQSIIIPKTFFFSLISLLLPPHSIPLPLGRGGGRGDFDFKIEFRA